jgi:hypothetical protein
MIEVPLRNGAATLMLASGVFESLGASAPVAGGDQPPILSRRAASVSRMTHSPGARRVPMSYRMSNVPTCSHRITPLHYVPRTSL